MLAYVQFHSPLLSLSPIWGTLLLSVILLALGIAIRGMRDEGDSEMTQMFPPCLVATYGAVTAAAVLVLLGFGIVRLRRLLGRWATSFAAVLFLGAFLIGTEAPTYAAYPWDNAEWCASFFSSMFWVYYSVCGDAAWYCFTVVTGCALGSYPF